jgi:hypothetical protein
MKKTLLLATSFLGLTAAAVLADKSAEDGWISLFNGKDLTGWTQLNGTATYAIEKGGVIAGKTKEGSPNSFLCTDKTYGDFELEFEVKVDDGLNSGVQIRSRTKEIDAGAAKNDKKGRVYGPQVEIESGPGQAAYIYGEATEFKWLSAAPKSKDKSVSEHTLFNNGKWNKFRVVAKGNNIKTWINGQSIADLTHDGIFALNPDGFIGLQVHSIPKDKGPFEVRWRNIRIKELK